MPDPSKREELRARVHRRAKQIVFRRRLRVAGAFVATVAVMAAIAGVALLPGSPVEDVRNVAAEPVATTAPEPTPSATPEHTPQPTPIATAEPTPSCRNSYDPACGEFRWDPEPAPNGAMTVEMKIEPAKPKASEEVTFTLTITDDSPQRAHIVEGTYGDGDGPPLDAGGPWKEMPTAHGPWTPPQPKETVTVDSVSHIYKEAGRYFVRLHSANYGYHTNGQMHPFGSEKTTEGFYLDVASQPAA